jgi:hypothetical protein
MAQSLPDQSGNRSASSFLRRHGSKILALMPLMFLVWVVVQNAVAVPFWDQWDLVPILAKMHQGKLTFHDLWVQHNEHRILFPKIIMLMLGRLTGWNIGYELAVNLLLAVGIFAAFAGQVKRTAQRFAWGGLERAIPAVSVVIFSICQYQNWLWGWQMQMFLNLLAVVGGMVLLADDTFRWRRFATAALLGVVATCSFADGILFWPIGLGVLFVVTRGTRERWPALIGWLVVSVLVLGAFFYHYQLPADHQQLDLIFKTPLAYAAYVFKYLGGICEQGLTGDTAVDAALDGFFGLAGTLVLGGVGWLLVRKRIASLRMLVPYLAVSLYSVGSALLTGVGRMGLGSDQALSSRYGTMATPLWVSMIVFLAMLVRGNINVGNAAIPEQQTVSGLHLWNCQTIARWILGGIIALLVLGSVFAVDAARDLSQVQAYGRARLLELVAQPGADIDYFHLAALHPRPQVVVERYPILVQYRLSVFHDQK